MSPQPTAHARELRANSSQEGIRTFPPEWFTVAAQCRNLTGLSPNFHLHHDDESPRTG